MREDVLQMVNPMEETELEEIVGGEGVIPTISHH